jgi:hypothetical protein
MKPAARSFPGTGSAQSPQPAAERPVTAHSPAPSPAKGSNRGTTPGLPWRYNAFQREARQQRRQVQALVIPEGSDGEPVRDVRTKVKVSKGEAIW